MVADRKWLMKRNQPPFLPPPTAVSGKKVLSYVVKPLDAFT